MLSWQPPKHENGITAEYLVYYTDDRRRQDSEWTLEPVLGDRLTTQISGLEPATLYYFKIQARNDKGYGPQSAFVEHRTRTVGQLLRNDARELQPSSSSDSLQLDKNHLLAAAGGLCAVLLAILLCVALWCCCRRRDGRAPGHGYQKGKRTDVKPPPDLWIGHEHVETTRHGMFHWFH